MIAANYLFELSWLVHIQGLVLYHIVRENSSIQWNQCGRDAISTVYYIRILKLVNF